MTRILRTSFTTLALLAGLGLSTQVFAGAHHDKIDKTEKTEKTEKSGKVEKSEKSGK